MKLSKEKPFEGILGNTCELRLLEYLMSMPNFDFNITEISNVSGVSRQSTDKVIKKFLEWNIVTITRRVGNMSLYQLDIRSPFVNLMYGFNNDIIEKIIPEEFNKEIPIQPQQGLIGEHINPFTGTHFDESYTPPFNSERFLPVVAVNTDYQFSGLGG